jgi:hypothetical protein
MSKKTEIPLQLKRRTHLLDRVIDNLLPNMYPCDYNSSDHFVIGVLDEIIWFLVDVEELRGVERTDIDDYIFDYKYDEITNYFNERCGDTKKDNLQESIRRILREETELPSYIRRRVNMEELDDLVLDVKELIDSDYDKTDAIYDTIRQFIATKKSFKFDYETERQYWDSYIDIEKPLVNYVKTKLNI